MRYRWGVGNAALLVLLLLGGCWSRSKVMEDAAFQGPAVAQAELGGRHLLLVTAPTPGWRLTIDRTEHMLDETHVFVTMQRPDPGALYAQVMVEQRLLTDVAVSRPMRVYARVIDFGQRKHLPPYRLVQPAGTVAE